MRQAIFLPPFDGLAEPDRLVELAVAAESVGWDVDYSDVVVLGGDCDDATAWSQKGATFIMTRLRPHRLDFDEALFRVCAGPRAA